MQVVEQGIHAVFFRLALAYVDGGIEQGNLAGTSALQPGLGALHKVEATILDESLKLVEFCILIRGVGISSGLQHFIVAISPGSIGLGFVFGPP